MKFLLSGILSILFLLPVLSLSAQEGGGEAPVVTPSLKLKSGDRTACIGQQTVFEVTASDIDGLEVEYTWYKGTTPLTGENALTLTLTGLTTEAEGEYFCRLYDKTNDKTYDSDKAKLTIPIYSGGLDALTHGIIGEALSLSAAQRTDAVYVWEASSAHSFTGHKIDFEAFAAPEREEKVRLTVTYQGCTFLDSTVLSIKYNSSRKVNVTASGKTEACVGETLTYTVEEDQAGTFSYQWFREGETTPAGETKELTFTGITPAQAGKYYCKVHDEVYDLDFTSNVLDVKVYPVPAVTLTTSEGTPCYGAQVNLTAENAVADLPDLTWSWKEGDRVLTGNTAATLAIPALNKETAVTYWAVASNHGCKDSADVMLTPKVPVTDIPAEQELVIGEPVTLQNTLQAGATYSWELKDEYTTNTEGNELSFTVTPKSVDTKVILTVSWEGCTRKDTTVLKVTHSTDRNIVVTASGKTAVCAGESFTYSVTEDKVGTFTYKWFREGSMEPVATTKDLAFSNATVSQSGNYYCEVYDKEYDLTFTSNKLFLEVYAFPEVSLVASNETPCYGDKVNLTASNAVSGLTDLAWSWKEGNQAVAGTAASLVTPAMAESAVTYWAVGDNHGCRDSAEVVLTPIVPVTDIPAYQALTIGSNLTIKNTYQAGATYTWNVTADNKTTNANGNEITFTVTPQTKEVFLTVDWQGCSRKDTTTFKVEHADIDVRVKAIGYTRVCVGDSLYYKVTVSEKSLYEYAWLKKGSATALSDKDHLIIRRAETGNSGEYYCKVYDKLFDLTFYSDTLNVQVSEYPQPVMQVETTEKADRRWIFCRGQEVELKMSDAKGLAEDLFLWTGSGLTVANGGQTARVTVADSAVYRARIINNGCIAEDSVVVLGSFPEIALPEKYYAIAGEELTVHTAIEDPAYRYTWTAVGASTPASAPAYTFVVPEGATQVGLSVKDGINCVAEATTEVNGLKAMNYTRSINDGFVVSRGGLEIIQKDTTLCARSPLTLEVAYTGYDGYTYEWMRGEEVVGTGRVLYIPAITIEQQGDYRYRVADVEAGGYLYSNTVKVAVKYRPDVAITAPVEGTAYCEGIEVNFSGRDQLQLLGSTTYSWSGSGIQSGRDAREMTARVGTNGYYTLIATDNGCSDTANVLIRPINDKVDIPSDMILAQPTRGVAFEAVARGGDAYTWYVNDVLQTVTGNRVELDLATKGTVVVEMTKGECHYYDTCRINMRPFYAVDNNKVSDDGFAVSCPVLRVTEKEIHVCMDEAFQMSVFYLGYDRYQYEWRKVDDFSTILSDSISYGIEHAVAGTRGKYYCRAFNPDINEYIYSDTLEVFVEDGPVANISVLSPDTKEVCFGQEITLVTTTPYAVDGFSEDPAIADNLLWSGEGIVSGQGTQQIKVIVGDNGLYTLKAVKNKGCSSQTSIQLNITKPEIAVPHVLFLSEGKAVEFEAKRTMMNQEIQWFVNGEWKKTDKGKVSLDLQATGSVKAVMSVSDKCIAKDSCLVFVKDQVSFEGGENDGFIVNRPKPAIPAELKYINVCPDSVVTLRVMHGDYPYFQYEWLKVGESEVFGRGKEFSFNARTEQNGNYYCRVVNPDMDLARPYIFSDTLLLTVYSGPLAVINVLDIEENPFSGTEICRGTHLYLDAGASGGELNYQWTGEAIVSELTSFERIEIAPEKSVTYMVRAGNGACSDTATISFDVITPAFDLPARVQLPVPETGYAFNVDIPADATVEWRFKPEEGTETTTTENKLNLTGDGWVYAKLTQNGCEAFDSCQIFVKQPVTYTGGENDGFSVIEDVTTVWIEPRAKDIEVCLDNQQRLVARARGLSTYSYRWFRLEGNTPIDLYWTDTTYVIDHMDADKAGKYFCIVTDRQEKENGGVKNYTTDTVNIILKNGPLAKIDFKDPSKVTDKACFGDEFELQGSNANAAIENEFMKYAWEGNTYEQLTEKIINARPQTDGIYILTVTDSREGGCSDTAVLKVDMYAPKVKLPGRLFMYEPGTTEILAETEGAGNLKWYIDYRNRVISEENPGRLKIQQDALVIAEFEQAGCSGFDTTRVFVKWPVTYAGGADDGFVQSLPELKAFVDPKFPEVCRGSDIHLRLRINPEGRSLKYAWKKVGVAAPVSYEEEMILPAKKLQDGGFYYCEVTNTAEENPLLKVIVSDTAEVTVLNGPIAKISSPEDSSPFCHGETVTIDATATETNKESVNDEYVYEWFGANISNTGKQHIISAVAGEQTRYIVKASMGECATFDTVDLKVYRPDIRIQPVMFLSRAASIKLGVANDRKEVIKWHQYLEDDLETPYQTVTADTCNLYIPYDTKVVVERQSEGCSGYDTCEVFVKQEYTFKGGEEDGFVSAGTGFYIKPPKLTDYVCVGETATIWTEVVGNDFYHYEWHKAGDDKIYAETALCKLAPVTKAHEGYYYCIITDVNNGISRTSERVYLNVKEKPVSRIIVPQTLVCYDSEVQLEADQANLKEGVTYTYLWQGLGIKNPTTSRVKIRAEKSSDYVLVVGDGDCFMEDTISLEVERTKLDYQPLYTIDEGETVDLWATLNGKPSSELTWKVDGDPYRNTSSVKLTNVTRSMPFTIETSGVCRLSRTGHIYVRNSGAFKGGYDDGFTMPNDLPQILDQCPELLGCDQDTAILWIKALLTDDLVYVWQKFDETQGKYVDYHPATGQTHVSGWDSDTLRFTSILREDEGRYRCCLKNNYGYSFSREIRLVKGGTPEIITYLNDGAICEGPANSFYLGIDVKIPHDGTTTGLGYEWYFAKDGINYSQIKPAVNYNYPSFKKEGLKEADEGYYMVKVANYCGAVYDTAFQEIWEAPTFVSQPRDTAVCMDGSITLTTRVQGGGNYGYRLWQVEVDSKKNFVKNKRLLYEGTAPEASIPYAGTVDEGYYTWVSWNECDSVRSRAFFLDVEDEIIPRFDGMDTTVCSGTRLVLVADKNQNIQNPTNTLRYYWEKDGQRLENSAALKYILGSVDEQQTGEYICYAYHSCNAKPIKLYSVNTKSKPVIIQQPALKNKDGFCLGEEVTITSNFISDGVEPVTMAWYYNGSYQVRNDKQVSGANSTILTIDSVSPAYAGKYDVRFHNECGWTTSNAANVIVHMPASFTNTGKLAAEVVLCSGETKDLRVTATGMAGITYMWMKDGKQVQFGTNPVLSLSNVSYGAIGQYCCYASNSCNIESAVTCTDLKVITPYVYDVLGEGSYCGNDGREVTLSGYQKGVVYTLYRRGSADETSYSVIKVVKADTVSTPVLSFGIVEAGLYHVEAKATYNSKTCNSRMNGEISIYRAPTPEQYVFHITDPMCLGEARATVTLEGTEVNTDITYRLERWNTRLNGGQGGWATYGATYKGDGSGHNWPVAEGFYRVMAVNTISGCKVQMGDVDTVASRPYPQAYDLFAVNGDTTVCDDMESDVVLKLSDSEKGTKYTLYKDEVSTERTLSGNLLAWDKVTEGTYTVRAVSHYGCMKKMGKVIVTKLPPLEKFLFSAESSVVYCGELDGREHTIQLEGSTEGIRYDFYSTAQQDTISARWGTGADLKWAVKLDGNATYYVVAVDTLENCYHEMPQRVDIQANRLQLSVESPIKVTASTQATLSVGITGAMAAPTITWKPAEKIAAGQGTANITTEVMKSGDRFWVNVDDGFCSRDTFIDVSVVGEPLNVTIKAGDCYTTIDTLFLCKGEEVSLCSYIGGGSGTYRFKWKDDKTDSIPVPQRSKLNYMKEGDGFVVLNVESDVKDMNGNVVTQKATDTVKIVFRDRPKTLAVGNQRLTCVLPGQSADIVLKETENEVHYQLQHFNALTGKYEDVTGAEKVGDGTDWVYAVTYSAETAGSYRVMAVKEYQGNFVCDQTYNITEYHRAPQKLGVTAKGNRQYCVDMERDSIVVASSEEGVVYRLLRDETVQLAQQTGNGEPLLFTGRYNSDAPGKHTYQVVATVDQCVDTMDGKAVINSFERPLIKGIQGVKDYCTTENVVITIPGLKGGTQCYLYKQDVAEFVKKDASSGTEDVVFDLAKTLGTGQYFVVTGYTYTEGANLTCTDTVKGLKVMEAPEALTALMSTPGYCEHLSGFDSIRLVKANPDIDYELFDNPSTMSRTSLGLLTHGNTDTVYYDGVLALPDGQERHHYYVYAHAGSCSNDVAHFELVKYAAPRDCKLYKELLGCVGYDLEMGVTNTEGGVKYTLYRIKGETIDSLKTMEGNTGIITFGKYKEEGYYYVVAVNKGGCSRKLTQEYQIRPLPEFYKIYTPLADFYCEGENGVQLGVTGTQDGVTYRLQKLAEVNGKEVWNMVSGAELLGTGSDAQLFAGYYPEGDYRVITDYCNLPMLDTLKIRKRPLPENVAVEIAGKACVDSTMQIRIGKPETGTEYALCYGGVATGLDTLSGAAVLWDINPVAEGHYTVVAELNGCRIVLADTVRPGRTVEYGDLAGIKAHMCAEDTTSLYLAAGEWDSKAVYQLYCPEVDSLTYTGVEKDGKMVFPGVAAGHDYKVVASHLSCTTEKGAYVFNAVALPVLNEDDFIVEDCKPDGEAAILLKNQTADYQYTLAGLLNSYTIKDHTGDTLMQHLDNGSYTYKVHDTKTGCSSLPLEAVIRRAVPATDTLTSLLAYCENGKGVDIRFSSHTFGVTYLLRQTDGTLIDSIAAGSAATGFTIPLTEGRYVFYREREGLWGGCWLADTFNIEKYPLPSEELTIQVPDVICETGDNTIEIQNSEKEVSYVLKNALSGVALDTVEGNGGVAAFTGRKPEGTYKIEMKYKGLCPGAYYKSFKVNPVPVQIQAADQQFCFDETGKGNTREINVTELKTSAEYVLYDAAGNGLDTIRGMIAGYFKEQPAGNYYVTGTYLATGCTDKVAEMSIRGISKPQVFKIWNAAGVGACGDVADVRLLDGYEGDSVKYYLYMNDMFKMAGPVTASNGEVKFGEFREVGEYKIYAEKGEGTCGVWMDSSVIIYAAPRLARLSVTGLDCGEGATSDVTISATQTAKNWLYYLTNTTGTEISEKLEGGENVISWTAIAGHEIKAGRYLLYATNPCDSLIKLDSIEVEAARRPDRSSIIIVDSGYFCHNLYPYEVTLDKAQEGVTYTLNFGDNSWQVDGVTKENLFLNNIENPGLATVYATVDSTGCTYFMDTLTIKKDQRPELPSLHAENVCAVGENAAMEISIFNTRLPKVDYYLVLNLGQESEKYVDTIPSSAPLTDTLFKKQREYGCYSVVVTSVLRHCNLAMDPYCMSKPPQGGKLVGGTRKKDLCEGDEESIWVEKSEVGVQYTLLDGKGSPCSAPVPGNGGVLEVGKVNKAGKYTVMASVSDECAVSMDDTVTVEIKPRPLLTVQHEYTYPDGEAGVKLEVLPETTPGVPYVLVNVNRDNYWQEMITSVEGRRVSFEDIYSEGKYIVKALGTAGNPRMSCDAEDSIFVRKVSLTPFRLEVLGTPYKCESTECRTLKLSGSEKGTTYSLYHITGQDTAFVALSEGTGKAISWGSQCDTGYFFVMGEKRLSETMVSRSKMGDDIRLYVSTGIEKFTLKGDIVGYCSDSDPNGKVVLDSSQSTNITYQLYCNGKAMPGKAVPGAGGSKLVWDKLEGLACVENNDVGNVYTVMASDGHCELEMYGKVNIVKTNPVEIRRQDAIVKACTGLPAGLTVTAFGCMLSYEWTHNGKVVGNQAGYTLDSVTMDDMGIYECKVSNYCNSVMADPMELNVRQVVTMPERMEDVLICNDDNHDVELISKAIGENYLWYRLGGKDTLCWERILKIPNATAEKDAGEYICYTWNDCGGLYDTVRLEFNRTPEVTGFKYKKDTICVNSPYEIHLQSRDSLVWYFNGVEMEGKHDKELVMNHVGLAREGDYKVKAVNRCQEKEFDLVKLMVDDTIRIISAPEASKHYCENTGITLEVKATPTERVEYRWWKVFSEVGTGNSYTFVANHNREDGYLYYVDYKNKCSSGRIEHVVHIDRAISLVKIPSPDTVCCNADEQKMIIVKDQAQTDRTYDEYKWYKRTDGEPVLMSESDTLLLDLTLANRGIYYAEVSNVCQRVNSADVDLRIDSVPVILEQPAKVTVCENGSAVFKVKATGGDLTYRWVLRKKDGTEEYQVKTEIPYESSAQWTKEKLAVDYDSASVWCIVENKCSYVSTDTVLLRVNKNVVLTTDQVLGYLCANRPGDKVKVAVQPDPAIFQSWNYYVEKDGVLIHNPRAVYSAYVDTLTLTEPGTYRIYDFETRSSGCVAANSEVEVKIENREIFTAVLSAAGKTVVCRSDEVHMQLHIEGGKAPWLVDIRRKSDNTTAPEIGGEPVLLYSRDTLFTMALIHDESFYIASANQYNDPAACDGEVSGEVSFTIQQPYDTRLQNISETTFGSCRALNLVSAFNPTPDVSAGQFYVNGVLAPDHTLAGKPGKYNIVYKSTTSAGCVDSTSITIQMDSLPTARVYAEKSDLCQGEYTGLYALLTGTPPFNTGITVYAYDMNGQLLGSRRPKPTLQITSNDYISYQVYNTTATADSIRIYEMTILEDKYGCPMVQDEDDRFQINMRKPPLFNVLGRHQTLTGGSYVDTLTDFVTAPTDGKTGVYFSVTPVKKDYKVVRMEAPWNSRVKYVDLNGKETAINSLRMPINSTHNFLAPGSGTYYFTVSDAYCSANVTLERTVTILDSAYVQVRAFLEGAYDKSNPEHMKSSLFTKGLVPLKKWAQWPEMGEYTGIDWITLEVRDKEINGKTLFSEDYLLRSDGYLVDRYGNTSIAVPKLDFLKEYWIVLKHRNHLATGSSRSIKLSSDRATPTLVDFTVDRNNYVIGNIADHMKYMQRVGSHTIYAMPAGNVLLNSLISMQNTNTALIHEEYTLGYYDLDVNFDGLITLPDVFGVITGNNDVSIIYDNRDRYSVIKY